MRQDITFTGWQTKRKKTSKGAERGAGGGASRDSSTCPRKEDLCGSLLFPSLPFFHPFRSELAAGFQTNGYHGLARMLTRHNAEDLT